MAATNVTAQGGWFVWRKIQATFPEVRLNKWKARVYVSLKSIDELQCKEHICQEDLDQITHLILQFKTYASELENVTDASIFHRRQLAEEVASRGRRLTTKISSTSTDAVSRSLVCQLRHAEHRQNGEKCTVCIPPFAPDAQNVRVPSNTNEPSTRESNVTAFLQNDSSDDDTASESKSMASSDVPQDGTTPLASIAGQIPRPSSGRDRICLVYTHTRIGDNEQTFFGYTSDPA